MLGSNWLFFDLYAERPKGVIHSCPYRARSPDYPGFTDALGAQNGHSCWRGYMHNVNIWHFRRHRNEIFGKVSV